MPSRDDDRSADVGSEPTAELEPGPAPQPRAAGGAFAPGDLVATRYKIVKALGAGGMGEVYHAEDLLLGEQVALKTIRADIARDERVVERFKREIQLARKVTHANVCRLFDVGLHRPAGAGHDVVFLTMELVDGENLATSLHRDGAMEVDSAGRLLAQMAAALAAAHQVGIVHRDFKSANVMLDKSGRAVVTDFGLARAVGPESAAVTGDGGMVGSPAYMAPEQIEGGAITAATDVYALGVVLYEMVTGELPFIGDSPMATALKRLREDPDPPVKRRPGLDPRWNQVILRCLARRPEDRYASAAEVLAAIQPTASSTLATGTVRETSRKIMRWPIAVGLGALVAGAILLVPRRSELPTAPVGGAAGPAAAAVAPARRSVAVLGFKNLTGRVEAGWISNALAEMLATELAAGGELRTVPGESVARARRELALGDDDAFASDTLARLRQVLDTDYILIGSYVALGPAAGGKIRFDMKLQDTRTGDTVAALSQTGTEAEMVDLVGQTGAALRARLAVAQPSPTEIEGVHASMPARPEVARLYSEGLAHLRVEACAAARAPLEQAVAADPGFALAHAALAEALSCLGYDERALAESKVALQLAANLPEQIRLTAQARLYEQTRQLEPAVDAWARLFAQFPDNFDYGIHLAEIQLRAMRTDDALVTLARLRQLPPPAGDNPRIDADQAQALLQSNQVHEAVALAGKAGERAEAQGARLVAADAFLVAARAQVVLGDNAAALAALTRAKAIFEAASDRAGLGAALGLEAWLRQSSGDTEAVRKLQAQAANIDAELGNANEVLRLRLNVATALQAGGDLDAALAAYHDVAELAHARQQPLSEASALIYAATISLSQADLPAMEALIDRGLALHPIDEIRVTLLLLRSAALMYADQLDQAQAQLDTALVGASAPMRAVVELQRAWLDLERGDYARAEKIARAGLTQAPASKVVAQLALARALLEEGKPREALAALPTDPTVVAKLYQLDEQMAPIKARARAALGGRAEVDAALHELESLIASAVAHRRQLSALDLRLALGQIQLQHGHAAAGRQTLTAVAADARARGVPLFARRAQALLAAQ